MKVIVTGREVFGPACTRADLSWGEFVAWSGLNKLEELVSLDPYYNVPINDLQAVYESSEDLLEGVSNLTREMMADKNTEFGFSQGFNLLATIVHPTIEGTVLTAGDFEFIGYDIVHKSAGHSLLVQLGWLTGTTFLAEVNRFGLLEDSASANLMLASFKENYPEMGLVEGSVAAVWRHTVFGRTEGFRLSEKPSEFSQVLG